jgi:hypothetical protein
MSLDEHNPVISSTTADVMVTGDLHKLTVKLFDGSIIAIFYMATRYL